MATKKKKAAVAPTQLKTGGVIETDKLDLRVPTRRGSMYDTIYAKMAKLKEGKSFTVPVPKGISVRTLQNRMNAAIRRGPVEAPKGCVFRKYTTTDGQIAIACIRNDSDKKDKRFRGAKSKPKSKPAKKAKPTTKKSVKAVKKPVKKATKKSTKIVKTEVAQQEVSAPK